MKPGPLLPNTDENSEITPGELTECKSEHAVCFVQGVASYTSKRFYSWNGEHVDARKRKTQRGKHTLERDVKRYMENGAS